MDVNIKGLERELVARLAEQAAIEGMSSQEWMRRTLRARAATPTPTERAAAIARRSPMSNDEYLALIQRERAEEGVVQPA